MKLKRIFTLIWILAVGTQIEAQTTYYTGFDNKVEKAGWSQFRKGKLGRAEWEIVYGGGINDSLLTHSAPTGDANKDSLVNWYVSPKFNFSGGGEIVSLKFNYFCYLTTFFPEQVVQIYLLVGSQDPSLATSKILLADFTSAYSGDRMLWKDTASFPIPNATGDCYVGFKFVAIDGWSSISFDNIHITANKPTVTKEMEKSEITTFIYPNPTEGLLSIASNQILRRIDVFDLAGLKVGEFDSVNQLNTALDLEELGKGIYTIKVKTIKGVISKRIIKL